MQIKTPEPRVNRAWRRRRVRDRCESKQHGARSHTTSRKEMLSKTKTNETQKASPRPLHGPLFVSSHPSVREALARA